MVRDGRLSERQLVHYIATHTSGLADQEAKDLHARRVSEGLREDGEILVSFVTLDRTQVRLLVGRRATGIYTLGP